MASWLRYHSAAPTTSQGSLSAPTAGLGIPRYAGHACSAPPASAVAPTTVARLSVNRVSPEALAALLNIQLPTARTLASRQPQLMQQPAALLVERVNLVGAELGVSMEQVAIMLSRQPGILSAPASVLRSKVAELSEQLGPMDTTAAAALLARQPELLEVPAARAAQLAANLAHVSGVSKDCLLEGATMIARLPPPAFFSLLQLPPGGLAARASQLAAALTTATGCHDPALLQRTVQRCPALLAMRPAEVAARVHSLAQLLGRPSRSALVTLLTRSASLLLFSTAELTENLVAMERLLAATPGSLAPMALQQPNLLKWAPETAAEKLDEMGAALGGVPHATLAAMLRRQPGLMAISAQLLSVKLCRLSAALQAPSVQATMAAVVRHPALLTLSSDSVDAKLVALSTALQLQPGQVCATVLENPALLLGSANALRHRLTQLAHIAGGASEVSVRIAAQQHPWLWTLPVHELRACMEHWCMTLRASSAVVGQLLLAHPPLMHARCSAQVAAICDQLGRQGVGGGRQGALLHVAQRVHLLAEFGCVDMSLGPGNVVRRNSHQVCSPSLSPLDVRGQDVREQELA